MPKRQNQKHCSLLENNKCRRLSVIPFAHSCPSFTPPSTFNDGLHFARQIIGNQVESAFHVRTTTKNLMNNTVSEPPQTPKNRRMDHEVSCSHKGKNNKGDSGSYSLAPRHCNFRFLNKDGRSLSPPLKMVPMADRWQKCP